MSSSDPRLAQLKRRLRGTRLHQCLLARRYLRSFLTEQWRRCSWQPIRTDLDLVLAISPESRGWILEGILREVEKRFRGTVALSDQLKKLPRAKAVFAIHYHLLTEIFSANPWVWSAKRVVWFTHPKNDPLPPSAIVDLNLATTVVSTCNLFVDYLAKAGVHRSRLTCILGGADPHLFPMHVRGSGTVGFCSAYYERKQPDLMLEIVKQMPGTRFRLLGRGWREYRRFLELCHLPNFEYLEWEYDRYPEFYGSLDVLVSTSSLEGGPIPIIEAMMSNVVPVATRTGFAPDVIVDGSNGFLLPIHAPAEQFVDRIKRALALQTNVRSTAMHLTWDRFAEQLSRRF